MPIPFGFSISYCSSQITGHGFEDAWYCDQQSWICGLDLECLESLLKEFYPPISCATLSVHHIPSWPSLKGKPIFNPVTFKQNSLVIQTLSDLPYYQMKFGDGPLKRAQGPHSKDNPNFWWELIFLIQNGKLSSLKLTGMLTMKAKSGRGRHSRSWFYNRSLRSWTSHKKGMSVSILQLWNFSSW